MLIRRRSTKETGAESESVHHGELYPFQASLTLIVIIMALLFVLLHLWIYFLKFSFICSFKACVTY